MLNEYAMFENEFDRRSDLGDITHKSLASLFRPESIAHGRWKQHLAGHLDLVCTLQGPGQAVLDMFDRDIAFIGKPAVFSNDVAPSIFFGWICKT